MLIISLRKSKSEMRDGRFMAVIIRTMTQSEFDAVCDWSVKHHAKELVKEIDISEEEAVSETIQELKYMLPDGLDTPDHYLMTIIEESSGEAVGFIWTLHEEFQERQQSFVCDFAIWEPYRRKGYATRVLALVEKAAAEAGCEESVLFVRDTNIAARALYKKCGYADFREKDYGNFMKKQIGNGSFPLEEI